MANPLKKLAGETAIYGLSTILARVLNFLLVPLYTNILTTADYGIVTEFLSYIAVLQVVLVLGLETGCFRFANKEGVDPNKVYTNALVAVFALNAAFLAILIIFANPIANTLGYYGHDKTIKYIGGILALDSITAILFARLRQQYKAVKFAIIKTIKIATELGMNLYLFLGTKPEWMFYFISETPDFTYPIFSILVSCALCAVIFIPDLLRFTFSFDRKLLKQMLLYSIPLMIAALPGILNDFIDRILFRFLDTNAEVWQSSLGVFQAAVKLAVLMNLFIQMFRYAVEPFFFQHAKEKGSGELYAKVMDYFTAFCGLVFLGVILYIDIISLILGKDFRVALGVVPIMLLSYMLLGMLFNVSMWYKLSGKTNMAIYITLTGLIVTIVVNVIFMPKYSYWAAAYGHLASYLVMFILSAALGQKYYPIPYNWKKLGSIFILMLGVYGLSMVLDKAFFETASWSNGGLMAVKLGVHTVLGLIYAGLAYLVVKKPILSSKKAA